MQTNSDGRVNLVAKCGVLLGGLLGSCYHEDVEPLVGRVEPAPHASAVTLDIKPRVIVNSPFRIGPEDSVVLLREPDLSLVPGRVVESRPASGYYALTFTPDAPLEPDTDYRIEVRGAFDGFIWTPDPLGSSETVVLGPDQWLEVPFTTRSEPRVRTVARWNREDGDIEYWILFTEAMDPATLTPDTVRGRIGSQTVVPDQILYDDDPVNWFYMIALTVPAGTLLDTIIFEPGIRSARGVEMAGLPLELPCVRTSQRCLVPPL